MATSLHLARLLDDDDELVYDMPQSEFMNELNKYAKIRNADARLEVEDVVEEVINV
jgi:hypothetical protein